MLTSGDTSLLFSKKYQLLLVFSDAENSLKDGWKQGR
jgi:hypothetical protein